MAPGRNIPEAARIEIYEYEAFPVGRRGGAGELIEMRFEHSDGKISHASDIKHNDSREVISISAGEDGHFFSGTREVFDDSGRRRRKDSISRGNGGVYIRHDFNAGSRTVERSIRADRVLAVDVSLLILLRSFNFDEPEKLDVFMVDFSGRSVFASVSLEDVEDVEVPAGKFRCYRMEVAVGLPVIRPRVTFWISVEKPHFMVKHSGRRGPFTPVYETLLLSKEFQGAGGDE